MNEHDMMKVEDYMWNQMDEADWYAIRSFCRDYNNTEEDEREDEFYDRYNELFSPIVEWETGLLEDKDAFEEPEEIEKYVNDWCETGTDNKYENVIKFYQCLQNHPEWETIQKALEIFCKEGW